MVDEIRYWEDAGARKRKDTQEGLWRAHSDAVNSGVLDRWNFSQPAGRVLKTDLYDEAMGEGMYGVLRGRFRCVVGMDLSVSTVRAARPRATGHPLASCDVRSLPFAGGAFDAVACISTLDHFGTVEELADSLAELHRVLHSGGSLVLTLDNAANPIIAVRRFLPLRLSQWLRLVPYFVGVNCGPSRLRKMLQHSGFKVIEMGAALHCPRILAVPLSRMVQQRAGQMQRERFLRVLMWFEKLSAGPFRFVTGHYLAVTAIKA